MWEKFEPAVSIANARVDWPRRINESPSVRMVMWMYGGRMRGGRKMWERSVSMKEAVCAIVYAEPLLERRKEETCAECVLVRDVV